MLVKLDQLFHFFFTLSLFFIIGDMIYRRSKGKSKREGEESKDEKIEVSHEGISEEVTLSI